MGRNLYILAGTIAALALIALLLSFSGVAQQAGAPSDALMWRMTSITLACVALLCALAGVLSALFEQAERRHVEERKQRREQAK